MPPENHCPGRVIHTLGYPFDSGTFGGTWLYDMADGLVSVGVVTGLNYENPYTDPHENLQRFKLHPKVRAILEGGECIRYGAKTLPAGGLFSQPRLELDGAVFVGDSAGFCNGQRLKGVHQAIKSGHLAAEALVEAGLADDHSQKSLSLYTELWKESWAYREHRRSRNWHATFAWVQALPAWLGWLRQVPWVLNGVVLALLTGGRGWVDGVAHRPDWAHMKPLSRLTRRERARGRDRLVPDNRYTFDKVTAVAHVRRLPRTGSAGAPADRGHEPVRHPLRRGVRQPLRALLPGRGLRDDRGPRGGRRAPHGGPRRELRALQDLRHRRSLSADYLDDAGGGRRPRLHRHVATRAETGREAYPATTVAPIVPCAGAGPPSSEGSLSAHEQIVELKARMARSIIGQEDVIERLVIGLLANGNLLVEGLPGLAKTRAVKGLAKNLEAKFSRIQFTPDLLPSDVLGHRGVPPDRRRRRVPLRPGSDLREHRAGRRDQPRPRQGAGGSARGDGGAPGHRGRDDPFHAEPLFMVMATQNPIEQEGTYPLPEAQMDRFLMHVVVDYPSVEDEVQVIRLVRDEESAASNAGGSSG